MAKGLQAMVMILCFSLQVISYSQAIPSRRHKRYADPVAEQAEIDACPFSVELVPDQSHPINLSEIAKGKYLTGFTCKWYLLGSQDCRPQFNCMVFDIRSDSTCSQDFVQVTDGLGGFMKECRKDKFAKPIVASRLLAHDLYVTMTISKNDVFDRDYSGVQCLASCVNASGDERDLVRLSKIPDEDRKFDNTCRCGVRKSGRIVQGKNVVLNEFPWQAAMVTPNTRNIRCGASIINNMFILTAAHCLYDSDYKDWLEPNSIEILIHANLLDQTLKFGYKNVSLGQMGSIQAPGWNLKPKTDKDENSVRFRISEIIHHPAYVPDDPDLNFDIALLRLNSTIDFHNRNSPVVPICLPNVLNANQSELTEADMLIVVGWGLAHENAKGSTRLLQKLSVPFIDPERCQDIVTEYEQLYTPDKIGASKVITEKQICAGFPEGGKDSCMGDSGGPLFVDQRGKYIRATQVGIVSHGSVTGCAKKGQVGIYSRVAALNQWLYSETLMATWCKE